MMCSEIFFGKNVCDASGNASHIFTETVFCTYNGKLSECNLMMETTKYLQKIIITG